MEDVLREAEVGVLCVLRFRHDDDACFGNMATRVEVSIGGFFELIRQRAVQRRMDGLWCI